MRETDCWQTITKALAEVQAALIQSKMVKFSSLKDAMEDLHMARTIELAAFFNIPSYEKGEPTGQTGTETEGGDLAPSSNKPTSKSFFKEQDGSGASPLSSPKSFVCSDCHKPVSWAIKKFCEEHDYDDVYCMSCQEKRRSKIENAECPRDVKF